MRAGGRGVDPPQRGNGQDTVSTGQIADHAFDFAAGRIENMDLARAQMGDEQPARFAVDALVIEAVGIALQGHISHGGQGGRRKAARDIAGRALDQIASGQGC